MSGGRGGPLLTSALVMGLALGAVTSCGKDEDRTSAFCAAIEAAPSLDAVITGYTTQDPTALEGNLDKTDAAYESLRATAPADIEGETNNVVDVVHIITTAIRNNPDDRQAAVNEVRAAASKRPGADASAKAVAAYAKKNCDVDLNAGLVDVAPTTPATTD